MQIWVSERESLPWRGKEVATVLINDNLSSICLFVLRHEPALIACSLKYF